MNLENMALGIPSWSTVFTAKSLGSISGQGSKITQAEGHSQKKQRNKHTKKKNKKKTKHKKKHGSVFTFGHSKSHPYDYTSAET